MSRLINLDFSRRGLQILPQQSIGKLTALQRFNLEENQLTSLPESFWPARSVDLP